MLDCIRKLTDVKELVARVLQTALVILFSAA
jgi:hypothetical protein